MKANFIFKSLIVFLFFSNYLSAQNYIKAICKLNSGETLEGLVKNDFHDEDDYLSFEVNNKDIKINLVDIKELVINDNEKYLSRLVEFHPNRLLNDFRVSEEKNTNLKKRESKQLLLKVLVEGKINLYQTILKGVSIFYFNRDNESFEYLEYYNYSNENSIKENDFFTRQLLKNVNCDNYLTDKYNTIKYNAKDLVRVVDSYNICSTGKSKIFFEGSKNENVFRVYLFGGVNFINGSSKSAVFVSNTDFNGNSISPSFGSEIAYIFPNRKNNSEIFSRIGFSSINFDQSQTFSVTGSNIIHREQVKFESSFINISLGYRYYLNSLKDSKKSNFGIDFMVNSLIPLSPSYKYGNEMFSANQMIGINPYAEADISSFINDVIFDFGVGLTYTYLKKYNLELRYSFKSGYTENSPVETNFSNIHFGFKYLIFQNKNNK